jgi:hypothetical protein
MYNKNCNNVYPGLKHHRQNSLESPSRYVFSSRRGAVISVILWELFLSSNSAILQNRRVSLSVSLIEKRASQLLALKFVTYFRELSRSTLGRVIDYSE